MPDVRTLALRRPARRDVLPARRDVLLAAGWFVLGTAFYAAGLQELVSTTAQPVPLGYRLVVLAVGCLAVALRRRTPLGCLGLAVLVAVLDGMRDPSLPVLLILTETLYHATLRGSPRASRAVAAAAAVTTAAVTVGVGWAAADWRAGVWTGVQAATVLLLPVWWATEVRRHAERARFERRSAAQQARIAELDRRAARGAERARMARDLHDVVAGHLSAIALQSSAVLSTAQQDPAAARRVLVSVRENSVQSLAEMRAMIDLLRAEEPEPYTAPARLAELARLIDSARASGLDVTVRTDLPGKLPAAVDLTGYRIVQEALTNAAKHAPGSRVTVAVGRDRDAVVVEVTNEVTNGATAPVTNEVTTPVAAPVAAPVPGGAGTGLVSMRERAAALGGTLTAGPVGGGWRVHAVLPAGGQEP